jgi:glyoxylase-like metal-dependent hydrolase (beta-lactamase superfamily II)
MKRLIAILAGLGLLLTSSPARAHDGSKPQDKGPFTLKKLTGEIYALFGRGGNIGLAVTSEGVVVIDDQFADLAPGIAEQIKSVTSQPIRFLINTHHHFDHTGGNGFFIKMTTIVAHDNVRKNMLMDAKTVPATEVPAPNLTFDREIRMYLGGKEIQVFHLKRGHTDGDSIIYFPQDKVVHMGDLFVNKNIPFIDTAHGGSTAEWIETLDAVISRVDPSSQLIPGHGEVGTVADLKSFKQYFLDLRAAVKKAVDGGMPREQAVKEIKLEQYSGYNGYAQRFASNVGTVYDEMKK